MYEQPIPSSAEQEGELDRAILGMLVDRENQRPWAEDEIAREMGANPVDSFNRLYGGGLIHRLDGFVWATRAALASDEIGA